MERTIFISYERKNRSTVEQLAQDLRDSGLNPFFDEQLRPAQKWWDELLDQIEKCDVFVPAVSHQYLTSEPCRLEVGYAAQLGKPILPVALDDVSPRQCGPLIGDTQWSHYKADDPSAFKDVMRGLNTVPPAPPLPDPMPARPEVPSSYVDDLVVRVVKQGRPSHDEQVLLVDELEERLHGSDAEDALELLRQYRARPDLEDRTVRKIDALLATATTTASASAPPATLPTADPPPTVNAVPPVQWPYRQPHHQQASFQPPQHQQPQFQQPHYQQPPVQQPPYVKPKNHMVWAVLTTVLFCLPLGAVAIYYATQVDKRFYAGDWTGADQAGNRARLWAIIGTLSGIVLYIVWAALAAYSASRTNTNSGF